MGELQYHARVPYACAQKTGMAKGDSDAYSTLEDSYPGSSGPMSDPLKLPTEGPFHLKHATHTRIVKGEVRNMRFRAAETAKSSLSFIQDIMFIEPLLQVG